MFSKGVYMFKAVFISLAIGVLGYVVRFPLLPLSSETKQSLGYPRESLLNITMRVARHGFVAREYIVETKDGYLLGLQRISAGRAVSNKRVPVLLMHGLLQCSAAWLDAGPSAGLAYLLARDHDVWLGNARGSHYSRGHTTLDPDSSSTYWQFSVDEIGRYDLPAIIDKVLNETGSEKLNYIGYSQGAGTYFIMCSELPEYCGKTQLMIALAPAARQTNTKSVLYRFLTETMTYLEGALTSLGVQEVFSKGSLSQEFLGFFCQLSSGTTHICAVGKDLLDSLDSLHPGSITNDTIRTLFSNFPAGTSVHNMARYGQSMKTEHFQKFDYGKKKNLALYGIEDPPRYNLSAVTVPLVAIYGRNDGLVDTLDVKWLLHRLPNVKESMEVKDPLWNHLDVSYSQYTRRLIYPKISEYLNKYDSPR